MQISRRQLLAGSMAGMAVAALPGRPSATAAEPALSKRDVGDLTITDLVVTPIALPDPPLLAASGCHGPYFLRNVVEIKTADGIVGIGETKGDQDRTRGLLAAKKEVIGKSAFAYGGFASRLRRIGNSIYAGVELACLDAIGRATGRPLCRLLGGPVRESVEFSSYLFFRYAADHPVVLADERLADDRGRGDAALDHWGEVRTPEAMAELAWRFHEKWGFKNHKLKAGVLKPEVELDALKAINDKFGGKHPLRIDPNARWSVETALKIGKGLADLPLEYYEDPVGGQKAMAEVRKRSGLKMSTNMCVTELSHLPEAIEREPIDVVLCDHHGWGGILECQALGRMAEVLGWGVSQHSNSHAGVTMATMIHLAAVVPELTYASDTHYIHLIDGADIIQGGKLPIQGGKMAVPTGPGLGVELDRDRLAAAHETYQKCGMRDRDDALLMPRLR